MKRPNIKIPKTKSEWIWDAIGYSLYLGSVIFLILVWRLLPEKVPAHYNALGEIDRWGGKQELLILPIVGLFIILLMQIMEKFPEAHNYPQRLNESNAEKFYLLSRKLMNQLKNICLILFAFILLQSVSIALGWEIGLGKWLLPTVIISTAVPIVCAMIKQKRIQ